MPWQFAVAELQPEFVGCSGVAMCMIVVMPSARTATLLPAGRAPPSYQKFPSASV